MRVGLFVTCLADVMRPSIGLAALDLLEQAGCEVIFPENSASKAFSSGSKLPSLSSLLLLLLPQVSAVLAVADADASSFPWPLTLPLPLTLTVGSETFMAGTTLSVDD